MKKGLMMLTVALFLGTVGTTTYAAVQNNDVQTECDVDGDKDKKKKKCKKKCKKECCTKEAEAKTCKKAEGEAKSCCKKK